MLHPPPSTSNRASYPSGLAGHVATWWRLTRPSVVAMVLLTLAVGASLGGSPPPIELLHALIGTAAVLVGAVAANQHYERSGDALMPRTAGRPLPARRLTPPQVVALSAAATLAGLAYLAMLTNWSVTLLAATSWLLYVAIYTPLKYRSTWQTPVGAAAGAMPVLIGAAVGDGSINATVWPLFAVVLLWQIPHAMAIAWLYRREFAQAGVRLLPVVEPSGQMAGAVALLAAAVLPLVAFALHDGYASTVAIAVLGFLQLAAAMRFAQRRTEQRARHLLWASMLYLPGVLLMLAISHI